MLLDGDAPAYQRARVDVDLLGEEAVAVLVAVDAAADPQTAGAGAHVEGLRLDPRRNPVGPWVDPNDVTWVIEPREPEHPHRTRADGELVEVLPRRASFQRDRERDSSLSGSRRAIDADLSSRSVSISQAAPSPAATVPTQQEANEILETTRFVCGSIRWRTSPRWSKLPVTHTLFNVKCLYMANRGIWEAIDSSGPACGIQATEADVERYLETLEAFLGELT